MSINITMVKFILAFENGFIKDKVIVKINNEQVYQNDNLSSDLRIGMSDVIEFDYPQGLLVVDISLPNKEISENISLELVQFTSLKISLVNSKLNHTISSKPLRYM